MQQRLLQLQRDMGGKRRLREKLSLQLQRGQWLRHQRHLRRQRLRLQLWKI
jgi:hypothetical protein